MFSPGFDLLRDTISVGIAIFGIVAFVSHGEVVALWALIPALLVIGFYFVDDLLRYRAQRARRDIPPPFHQRRRMR